uniref:Uncharacterized protein n=1 Tax=Cacopsylla melanoneura TaxID=428564 RepID=A0A8D8U7S5_9HEMI
MFAMIRFFPSNSWYSVAASPSLLASVCTTYCRCSEGRCRGNGLENTSFALSNNTLSSSLHLKGFRDNILYRGSRTTDALGMYSRNQLHNPRNDCNSFLLFG